MDILSAIDHAIREGQMDKARRDLDRLNREGVWGGFPPARLANLLWRIGAPGRGQRLLARRLPEMTAHALEGQPEEAAEYAACLLRLGAFAEAEWILRLPAVAATRMASLYEGFVHLETWDYPKAIPCFTRFVNQKGLSSKNLSDYWLRVGYANLASAMVYERRHDDAGPLLSRLLHDSHLTKNLFMLGFVLELAAADRVIGGDHQDARKFLAEAERRWGGVDGLDHFFLEKWRALADIAENPGSVESKARLEPLKKKAVELGHWETLRDCDRYVAIWTKDRDLFLKLFFGTPFPAFRARLRKDFGPVEIPERYALRLGGDAQRRQEIDLLINDRARLASGISSQSYALLAMLATDFYRAHRLVTLFGWLFPDQHFQPQQVPKRMHEAVRRLNAWLRAQKTSLNIVERHSEYALTSERPTTLLVPIPADLSHGWQPMIVRLSSRFGQEAFATREAQEFLGLARRTLVRQLQSLVVIGHLEQLGNGAGTRYRLSRTWKSDAA